MHKVILIGLIAVLMQGCESGPDGRGISSSEPIVCQGSDCDYRTHRGLPDIMPGHKATRDEKIRARQGENPDFGSDNLRIEGPGIRW